MTARVLIVDDEPVVRMTLKYALEGHDFAVSEADSAEAALADGEHFDLYLLDKNLPGMSGVDLARAVRQRDARAAIVLITGYATVDSAVEAMGAGADGYLEKPFDDLGKVLARVKDAMQVAASRPRSPATARKQQLLLAGGSDCAVVIHAASALSAVSLVSVTDRAQLFAKLAAAPRPDVVLVDESIAPDDYLGLLQLVLKQVPSVVAIRTRPTVEDADQFMRIGVRSLLVKPLVRAVVDLRLKELIGQLTTA